MLQVSKFDAVVDCHRCHAMPKDVRRDFFTSFDACRNFVDDVPNRNRGHLPVRPPGCSEEIFAIVFFILPIHQIFLLMDFNVDCHLSSR